MIVRWLVLTLGFLSLTPPLTAAERKKKELKTYNVPYRLTEAQHVLVRAKINGKGPFNFIIDTGAPALFVATSVCKKLGIEKGKDGWGTFDRLEIEGGVVELKAKGRVETPFQIEGMNALGLAGADLHGIIGYNLLARYRMEFDFTKDKMAWTRLDFDPGLPKAMGKAGAPGGLDAMGTILKLAGMFMGKAPAPKLVFRGFLGVDFGPAGGKDGGVVINSVLAKGPADLAGLQPGDRITHFQSEEIQGLDDLYPLLAKVRAGQTARFTISRKDKSQKITVKVGEGL
jgi:hypothetical protein